VVAVRVEHLPLLKLVQMDRVVEFLLYSLFVVVVVVDWREQQLLIQVYRVVRVEVSVVILELVIVGLVHLVKVTRVVVRLLQVQTRVVAVVVVNVVWVELVLPEMLLVLVAMELNGLLGLVIITQVVERVVVV
jgi:hypothetical protein